MRLKEYIALGIAAAALAVGIVNLVLTTLGKTVKVKVE